MGQDVFICHSTDNKQIANELCQKLETKGFDVWIAPRNIPAGQNWSEAIYNAIRTVEVVILLMSESANQSKETKREIKLADEYDVPTIPVVIEDADIPAEFKYFLATIQRLNVGKPLSEDDYDRIARAIVANTQLKDTEPEQNGAPDNRSEESETTGTTQSKNSGNPSRSGSRGNPDSHGAKKEPTKSENDNTNSDDGKRAKIKQKIKDNPYITDQNIADALNIEVASVRELTDELIEDETKKSENNSDKTRNTSWSHFLYDSARTGTPSNSHGPSGPPDLAWKFNTNHKVLSCPIVVDNNVYVSSTPNFYILDAESGELSTSFKTGELTFSPSISNNTVYLAKTAGSVLAYEHGQVRWVYETDEQILSSPVVVNGTVYVGCDDENVYAMDARTGQQEWQFSTNGSVVSSPAVVDGTVFLCSNDNYLYAIDANTGRERWKFDTGSGTNKSVDYSSPVVENNVVYVWGANRNLYALDARTGKKIWNVSWSSNLAKSPAVYDGILYLGTDKGGMYALDAESGDFVWEFNTEDQIVSTPAVAENTLYFGSDDENLYALDAKTGDGLWKYKTAGAVRSSPTVANGKVYFGSYDNNVYALE